jgi:formylglycine-generating enzyme required for sulfatase activity
MSERERPRVPNHELVRVIGRGAYGEIWLARSLTGAWRAIKIVDRRTFDSEKAFQREFEGMARFEPISRSDAGFVDILHVGRDEEGHFFYYVMELADDHAQGEAITPEDYVPKTLRTELSRRSRLLVDECLSIGLSLTRALGVLHQRGLVHRDIKPANVIFVGGTPKIADIGLVAAHGQDTYVGTEGYVPPEGPGAPQADLYSLGKVLYEMAMGKDRMDFPALHTDLVEFPDRERLLRLNEILLRACAPDCGERYATAAEMCEDLERVRDGRVIGRRRRWVPAVCGAAALLLLAGGAIWWQQTSAPGAVVIRSEPPGAMVVLAGTMHRSPAEFRKLPAGTHSARVMLPGFDPVDVAVEIAPGKDTRPAPVQLQRSKGRLAIRSRPEGAAFEIVSGGAVLERGTAPKIVDAVASGDYEVVFQHRGQVKRRSVTVERAVTATAEAEFGVGRVTITSEPAGAEISIDGQTAGPAPLSRVLPEGTHEIVATYRSWPEQRRSIETKPDEPTELAFSFVPGSVKITSAPGGASIFVNGEEIGQTTLLCEDLPPGPVKYELRLEGYRPVEVNAEVKPGEQTFLPVRFVQRSGPRKGGPWENSVGMRFAPVGDVLVCVWPTRVCDYEAFCRGTGRELLAADFPQDATHPVVRVNWEDATAFCQWLTEKEITEGGLEHGQHYRLPTDLEWSQAAGLPPETGATPEERDGKLRDYPWGHQWPPPQGAGNYADVSAKRGARRIAGYQDGFAQTSPVETFAANAQGLYDIGGNVWQWVQDSYTGGSRPKDWGVLRGGSWSNAAPAELRSSYRNVIDRAERDVIFGFRVVLVPDQSR